MTITMIIICILLCLLAISLCINVWLAGTLENIDKAADADGELFGWTVKEYQDEIAKLRTENAQLSSALYDAKQYIDRQKTKISFLMEGAKPNGTV